MMRLLTFCVCASSLLAQGGPIVVVDAANGPGTNFVDVQAAVLAAPDGSVLLVRPGAYAPVTIDGKGVTVVAESSFTIQGSLSILNTNAQQRVVVRGFVMGGFGNNVVLSNAAGPVTLDAVGQSLQSHGWGQTGLIVSDCQQVVVRNGTVVGTAYASAACWVTNSSVVFENCALRGSPSQFTSQGGGPLATPALVANASTVQLVDSSAEGGAGAVFVWIFGPIYFPPLKRWCSRAGRCARRASRPTSSQEACIRCSRRARRSPAVASRASTRRSSWLANRPEWP